MPFHIATVGRALLVAVLLSGSAAKSQTVDNSVAGPVVMQLPASMSCQAQVLACNRLALDDARTTAKIDEKRREIRISNAATYADETIVADVLLHASARVAKGSQPYLVHLVVSKKGTRWKHRLSTYAVTKKGGAEPFEFETWKVFVGGDEQAWLTPSLVKQALGPRSFTDKAKDFFVRATDLRKQAGESPAIELGLGIGPLRFGMTRAHYVPPRSVMEGHGADLAAVLAKEDWSFDFQTLSSLVPLYLIRHDLFLFGLDKHPLLQDAIKAGFRGNERLKVGVKNGAGYVQLDDRVEPYEQASQTALVFLRDTYLGMLLNAQAASMTPSPAKN